MDTHGHHQVLSEGAVPRLERAFAERGEPDALNVNAVYLGNWLADLSQVDDPGSTLAEQLQRDVVAERDRRAALGDKLATQALVAATPAGTPTSSPEVAELARLVRTGAEALVDAVSKAMVRSGAPGPGKKALGQHLLDLVRVVGYLQFACKESHPQRQEISPATYFRIADELGRQYLPHEHLDRPVCAVSYRDACTAAWGVAAQGQPADRIVAVARDRTGADPHLYSYLVDDRTVLAGELTRIDLGWTSVELPPGGRVSEDERDLWAARLGHTLHGVEDFYAHSTFIEHAIVAAEDYDGLARAIANRSVRRVGEPVLSARAENRVVRRLLRYSPLLPDRDRPGAPKPQAEDAVVTGYFDGWDTLNSLLHFVEELFRPTLRAFETRRRRDPTTAGIVSLLKAYADELGEDVFEVIGMITPTDPSEPPPWDVRIRRSLIGLLDYAEKARAEGRAVTAATLSGRIQQDTVLKVLKPDGLVELLVATVIALTDIGRQSKNALSVYKALMALLEFAENPVAYLLKPLEEKSGKLTRAFVAGALGELVVKDKLVELNHVLLTELQDYFRADRVGCHSLLAKDQPTEPVFDEMFRCARHADWAIVDALCRWSDARWYREAPADQRYLRFDELLAHYVRAPADIAAGPVERVTWRNATVLRVHEVTRPDETLQTAYRALAALAAPAHGVGTYEEFLLVNLGDVHSPGPVAGTVVDEDRALALAVAAGLAVRTPRGHRLAVGTRLVLPVRTDLPGSRTQGSTWFADVMAIPDLDSWRAAVRMFEVGRVPREFAHPPFVFHPGRTETEARRPAEAFVAAAGLLRDNLTKAYPSR